jgi:hypothetical protein
LLRLHQARACDSKQIACNMVNPLIERAQPLVLLSECGAQQCRQPVLCILKDPGKLCSKSVPRLWQDDSELTQQPWELVDKSCSPQLTQSHVGWRQRIFVMQPAKN